MIAMVEDPFADFSDLSEDDFNAITRATQFMGLSPTANSTANGSVIIPEMDLLRDELHQARHKAESLERSLLQVNQEKMTKEGEVAILRDRLLRIEAEKNQALMKTCDRLKESEGSRRTLEEEYRRTVNGLKTEITFKDQEIESLTSAMQGASLNSNAEKSFIPEGFEDFAELNRKRPVTLVVREDTKPPIKPKSRVESENVALFSSERELLDESFACVEYQWEISKLMEYDYTAILKRKAEMQKDLLKCGALFVILETAYDKGLEAKREIVFRYIAKVVATCIALDERLSLSFYNRSTYPKPNVHGHCSQFLVKVCKYLNSPPFGTTPSLLKAHIDILRMILVNATNAIPLEVKELLEASILQRFLYNQIERDEILHAFICLMESLSIDRSAVGLLLKQCPAPINSSMLALVVKVGIERLQKEEDSLRSSEKVIMKLIEFLCGLSKRNLVPINVAFDRRLLYELVDWLHRKVLDNDHLDDYQSIIDSIYYVFLEKGCDLKGCLESRTFALHYIMQRLLLKHHPTAYSDHLKALLKASETVLEEWVRERDADWGFVGAKKIRMPTAANEQEDLSPPAMQVSDEELAANQIPLNARDCCAHLLIPLNRCRRESYYNRLKCHDERHSYEACLYKDFLRRQKVWSKLKEEEKAAAAASSNK